LQTLSADDDEEEEVAYLLNRERCDEVGEAGRRRKMRKNERESPRHRVIYTLSGGKR
jgi:hypothetical protein